MKKDITSGALGLISITVLVVLGMWGCPQYNLYAAQMRGKAAYLEAQQNRQIRVQESLAKEEASRYEAQAEVIRARGVDSAIRIISGSLQSNMAYIQYLWVNNMEKQDKTVVYVPSGGMGLPITEAHRLNEPKNESAQQP